MNGIRTITLDLDDTLWEIQPVILRAEKSLHAWLDEYYPSITERFDLQGMMELRQRVAERHADKAHDLGFLRRRALLEMASLAGLTEFRVDEAFAVFMEIRNDVELFPEARVALAALRERFTLIAVTNGNADLRKIGIHEMFDGHISAVMAGAAKPNRPIFDAAVSAGGAAAHETIHVGDHPLYDVHGARRAGLRTVWVNRNGEHWPSDYELPDVEVRHVGELVAVLDGA